jgi:hypothetical protein
MARRVNMHLDEEFAAEIERHKPKSLALAAFCALLIEQALDKAVTLTERATADPRTSGDAIASGVSKAVSSSSKTLKPIVSMSLPAELEPEAELIREFWKLKKGSKGETAWKLLTGELLKIRSKHGNTVMREQLELAINGKWQGITLRNYENFSAPKGNTPAQPEHKHPAARVFQGGRFVDEDGPTTNPALEGLF